MTKFLDYKNPVSNDNRIYSEEDLNNMSKAEMIKNHDALTAQSKMIGFPKNFDLAQSHNTVYVHSYFRQDGTFVHGYWRSVNRSGTNEQGQNNNYAVAGNNTNSTTSVKPFYDLAALTEFVSNEGLSNALNPVNQVLKGAVQENKFPKLFENIEKKYNKTWKHLENVSDYVLPVEKPNGKSKYLDYLIFCTNHDHNQFRQNAAQLFDIAVNKLKRYENNSQFIKLKNSDLTFIKKIYGLPENLSIDSNMNGLFFSNNSRLAQSISNNLDFQSTILNTYNTNTGHFNINNILVEFKNDEDLAYAIGHATVFNPHITKDGYFEGILFDKYDFNYMPYKDLMKNHNKNLYKNFYKVLINNSAYLLQENKMLENYYYFVPVKFKLSK